MLDGVEVEQFVEQWKERKWMGWMERAKYSKGKIKIMWWRQEKKDMEKKKEGNKFGEWYCRKKELEKKWMQQKTKREIVLRKAMNYDGLIFKLFNQ